MPEKDIFSGYIDSFDPKKIHIQGPFPITLLIDFWKTLLLRPKNSTLPLFKGQNWSLPP